MTKSKCLLLAVSILSIPIYAEIPICYYESLDEKKDADLKQACHMLIRNLNPVTSYADLPKYFRVTDVHTDTEQWWDMYSDEIMYAPSFSGLNREHSFPKSWWGGYTDVNAYTDLFHLYPAEAVANQAKSNYPLGIVDRTSRIDFDNGVSMVGVPVKGQGGGAKYVFEPDDAYKGDFARSYFYMVTCYQDYRWNDKYAYMVLQNTYPTLNDWSIDLLLKWSREDPVSQKEVDRNEAVYSFQKNRNPFIDFPDLAEYIWGDKIGCSFTVSSSQEDTGEPALITPTQGMTFDIGQVAIGQDKTTQVFIKGEYLTAPLSLMLYTGNRSMFSIPTTEIPQYLANSQDGYLLTVKYTPSALGKHKTKLLIADGGMMTSVAVNIYAECLEVPVLEPCIALEPTDITETNYVANWEYTGCEEIDYYVVTRNIYARGEVFEEKIIAEETYVTVEGFEESDEECYYVQASRLGYLSNPSNVVFVNHAGITGVEKDEPLSIVSIDGGFRILCSADQSNACIYNAAGAMIQIIPTVYNNMEVSLPLGVYIIVTDKCRKPHKVVVN